MPLERKIFSSTTFRTGYCFLPVVQFGFTSPERLRAIYKQLYCRYMSIRVAINHRTTYKYDRPVSLGPQIVRLRPAPHSRTRILSYSLRISPEKHFINWQQDPQSNYLARLVFPEKTREFLVEVDLVAEMSVLNPFDFFLEPEAEKFPFEYDPILDHELEPFRLKCWLTPKFTKYLKALRAEILGEKTLRRGRGRVTEKPQAPNLRTIDFLVAINQRLWKDIKYLIRLEPGVQTPAYPFQ